MTSRTPDLLSAIVAATRRRVEVARGETSARALDLLAATAAPGGDAFRAALSRVDRVNVIAECKRRSPARGVLRRDYDPVAIATAYEAAGAAAVSVLTEPTFFDGTLEHLRHVRAAISLPLLRKDFVVDEWQLLEARAHGADAALLIVAALTDAELGRLHASARALGLAVLVEVHDAHELQRALDCGAELIGVNNRNLRTLQVDVQTSREMASRLPPDVVAISESGLRSLADLQELAALGYGGFLVGERFMAERDPGMALTQLLGGLDHGRAERLEASDCPSSSPVSSLPPALSALKGSGRPAGDPDPAERVAGSPAPRGRS